MNEFLNFLGKASHIENNVDEEDLKNEDDLKGEGQEMMDDEGSGEVFGKKSGFDDHEEDLKGTGEKGVVVDDDLLKHEGHKGYDGYEGHKGYDGYEVTRVTRGYDG